MRVKISYRKWGIWGIRTELAAPRQAPPSRQPRCPRLKNSAAPAANERAVRPALSDLFTRTYVNNHTIISRSRNNKWKY